MIGDPIETCCICGEDIDVHGTWTRGHNAQPVKAGRCCTECNNSYVIPLRIAHMLVRKQEEDKS